MRAVSRTQTLKIKIHANPAGERSEEIKEVMTTALAYAKHLVDDGIFTSVSLVLVEKPMQV